MEFRILLKRNIKLFFKDKGMFISQEFNNWYEKYNLVQLKHVESTTYGFEQVSFIKDLSACIDTNLNISNINESITFITCINII